MKEKHTRIAVSCFYVFIFTQRFDYLYHFLVGQFFHGSVRERVVIWLPLTLFWAVSYRNWDFVLSTALFWWFSRQTDRQTEVAEVTLTFYFPMLFDFIASICPSWKFMRLRSFTYFIFYCFTYSVAFCLDLCWFSIESAEIMLIIIIKMAHLFAPNQTIQWPWYRARSQMRVCVCVCCDVATTLLHSFVVSSSYFNWEILVFLLFCEKVVFLKLTPPRPLLSSSFLSVVNELRAFFFISPSKGNISSKKTKTSNIKNPLTLRSIGQQSFVPF